MNEFLYFCKNKNSLIMKKLLLMAIFGIISLCANAQLLWQVSGNGLGKPSYLMGTHHFAPESFIDSVRGLNEAINSCDIVCGEVVTDSLMSPATQKKMALAMIAPEDSTLKDVLSPAGLQIVERVVNKYLGIPLAPLMKLKPAALTAQIQAIQAMNGKSNIDPTKQIDLAVQKRAIKDGKPVTGFETADQQINILFNGPLNVQAATLLELCENDSIAAGFTDQMFELYNKQELDALYKMLTDPDIGVKPTKQELDLMVFDRNRAWVPQLEKMMHEGKSVLVCVGAGHLPGDQGLIGLLRTAGYTVTAVSK